MAMRKNDIEQSNAKKSTDEADDFMDEADGEDESVEDIDIKLPPSKDPAARKRLEEYLEERRLRKELDDNLFD